MKTNKILAVALSAGLVLGGAYVADTNVAFAEEAANPDELSAAKTTAKTIVDNNVEAGNLTKEEGETKKAEIDKAKNKDEIKTILNSVHDKYVEDQKAEKELTGLKKQAVAIVESNFAAGNIDETSKEDYINRVNTSKSKEEINGILDSVYQEYKNKQNPPKPEEKKEEESNIFDNQDEENNLMGYNSENSAEEAAKDAMEAKKGKYKKYKINQVGKKYFYELIPFENNNEDGFPTKEEAIKAAEKALEKDKINKSYTITQGANGRYFYLLSTEEFEQDAAELVPSFEKKPEVKPEDKTKPVPVPTPDVNVTPTPGEENKVVVPEDKTPEKTPGKEVEKEKDSKEGKDKKEEAKPARKKGNNPKTGIESLAPIYSTLAISMAGIVAARKKND